MLAARPCSTHLEDAALGVDGGHERQEEGQGLARAREGMDHHVPVLGHRPPYGRHLDLPFPPHVARARYRGLHPEGGGWLPRQALACSYIHASTRDLNKIGYTRRSYVAIGYHGAPGQSEGWVEGWVRGDPKNTHEAAPDSGV